MVAVVIMNTIVIKLDVVFVVVVAVVVVVMEVVGDN